MIRLTRLNHLPLVLNCDLIEHIDVTPDTVITLTSGQVLRVRESADEVVHRIVEFRRRVLGATERDIWPETPETTEHPAEAEDMPVGAAPETR